MKVARIHDDTPRTHVIVLAKGDETVGELTEFASTQGIEAASLTAIGAFSSATIGFFDRAANTYDRIHVDEQVEVLSLVGGIAVADDGPKLHAHVVLGRRDGSACGGHLLEGVVWPTLEVVVTEVAHHLHRRVDPETGLPLIDLGRGHEAPEPRS